MARLRAGRGGALDGESSSRDTPAHLAQRKRQNIQTSPILTPEMQLAILGHQRKSLLIDRAFGLLRTVARGLAWVGTAGFLYLTMDTLAGKDTLFRADVGAALKLAANEHFFYLAAILVTSSGWAVQTKLKRKAIKNVQAHVTKLEKLIDPKRSSSDLLKDGQPAAEDRDVP